MTLHAHLEEDEHGAIRQLSFSTPNSSPTSPATSSATSAQSNALAPLPDRLTPLDQANELELVNEIVEQAFVDNLFNGAFYSQTNSTTSTTATRTIQINNNVNSNNSENQTPSNNNILQANEINNGVRSGSGQVDLSIANSSYSLANHCNRLNEERSDVEDGQMSTPNADSDEKLINILIRFVNEKEMRIKAKPNDTILVLKK